MVPLSAFFFKFQPSHHLTPLKSYWSAYASFQLAAPTFPLEAPVSCITEPNQSLCTVRPPRDSHDIVLATLSYWSPQYVSRSVHYVLCTFSPYHQVHSTKMGRCLAALPYYLTPTSSWRILTWWAALRLHYRINPNPPSSPRGTCGGIYSSYHISFHLIFPIISFYFSKFHFSFQNSFSFSSLFSHQQLFKLSHFPRHNVLCTCLRPYAQNNAHAIFSKHCSHKNHIFLLKNSHIKSCTLMHQLSPK